MTREIAVDDDGQIRLQKLLAQSGVASRRRCEELMLDGEVEVDGEVVTRLGTKVDPRTAVIKVSGKRLPPVSDHIYLVLNKPRGVVSTMADPEGRRTIADFVGDRPERLFHVGRLDKDSEGLLLLTDDGKLQAEISSPRFKLPKTYLVQVEGIPDEAALQRLRTGITLNDGPTRPAEAKRIDPPALWERNPPVRYRKRLTGHRLPG